MLERPKDFRLDRFELEVHLVAGAAAALHPVASLAFELAADQPPLLRQRMMGRSGDLRQRLALIAPRDDMTGTGDVDHRLVFPTFDRAGAINLKQLGMQGAPKQLKHQLGDFRSNRQHGQDPRQSDRRTAKRRVNEPYYKRHAQGDKETFLEFVRARAKTLGQQTLTRPQRRTPQPASCAGLDTSCRRLEKEPQRDACQRRVGQADQYVVQGVRAGRDAEAAIDEQRRKEDAGQTAKRSTKPLQRLAMRTDIVGRRKNHARRHDRQRKSPRPRDGKQSQQPCHGWQQQKSEQRFFVDSGSAKTNQPRPGRRNHRRQQRRPRCHRARYGRASWARMLRSRASAGSCWPVLESIAATANCDRLRSR